MTLDQVHKAKAILLSIVAVLTGLLFLSLDWAPRIDFDVTGFLFLLGNAGRLTALVAFAVFSGMAIYFWTQVYLDRY